jgi:uncharacterized membrane protein
MSLHPNPRRSIVAEGIYGLLNPIPFGCFVAALIFDIIYSRNAVILWDNGTAWLIVVGLLFAVVPRLLNLTQVWVTARETSTRTDKLDFWRGRECAVSRLLANTEMRKAESRTKVAVATTVTSPSQ